MQAIGSKNLSRSIFAFCMQQTASKWGAFAPIPEGRTPFWLLLFILLLSCRYCMQS